MPYYPLSDTNLLLFMGIPSEREAFRARVYDGVEDERHAFVRALEGGGVVDCPALDPWINAFLGNQVWQAVLEESVMGDWNTEAYHQRVYLALSKCDLDLLVAVQRLAGLGETVSKVGRALKVSDRQRRELHRDSSRYAAEDRDLAAGILSGDIGAGWPRR